MAMETFDPKHLVVTAGNFRITGFAETMVTISRPNPMWNTQTGSYGDVCRVKSNDTTIDCTLTLQQCSDSNEVLSDFADEDEDDSSGVFTFTIEYKPSNDEGEVKTLLFTNDAYIEKKADGTWGNTPQDREWTIKCPNSVYKLGTTSTTAQRSENTPAL